MNLHEYQAKQLFARYGMPAPTGYACTTPREAEEAAESGRMVLQSASFPRSGSIWCVTALCRPSGFCFTGRGLHVRTSKTAARPG